VPPNSKAQAIQRCQLLDGRRLLLWQTDDPAVYVASLDAPGITKILPEGSESGRWPAYGSGYLLYPRGAATFARPFDSDQLRLGEPEVQLPDQGLAYTVSATGTIAYSVSEPVPSVLTWFGRDGGRISTAGEPAQYAQVVLSPSGRHATVVKRETEVESDLWDIDLTTSVFSRVTTAVGLDTDQAWSPDERPLVFTSNRIGGRYTPFIKDLVDGKETPLVTSEDSLNMDQWSPDGRFVIARMLGRAVYAVPVSGPRTPKLLVDTPYIKDEIHVSPDGQWVASNANESGAWEVYVAAFPSFTSKRQVSSGGGVQPQWRADGRELFYVASEVR